MGGKAIPTHPDYLTRSQASYVIAKAITGKPNDKLGHMVYRRIGEYQRAGKLKCEPVASGRTKQFHKLDLHTFSLEVFDVDVKEFKWQGDSTQIKKDSETEESVVRANNDMLTNLTDIRSIIHLHDKQLLDDSKAISMIKKLVSTDINGGENNDI